MHNLFYSPTEKILFWIAGYTWDGNTSNVLEKIQSLTEKAKEFSAISGCDLNQVKTDFITKSQRYKYMRFFFCATENVPEEAFVLSNHTMWSWIEN